MSESTDVLFIKDIKICKELKIFQFDEPFFARFWRKGNWQLNFLCKPLRHNSGEIDSDYIGSPTYEQVINWFRETHNMIITVNVENFEKKIYSGHMENTEGFYETDDYDNYYIALKEIIIYSIDSLK